MLKKLTVRNFKSLDGVTFEFENINLFVGPNASGKSSALQAIEILPALLRPSITEFFEVEKGWNYRDLPHRKNLSSTMTWEAEYHLSDAASAEPAIYRYDVTLQPRKHLGIGRETLSVTLPGRPLLNLIDRTGTRTRIFDEAAQQWREESIYSQPCSVMQGLKDTDGAFESIIRFRTYLERFQAFLLWNPRDMKKPHQGLAQRLGPSGEQLAGFWAYLQRKEPEKAAELLRTIQRIFPRVEAIRSSGKQGWAWHHLSIGERIGDRVIQYPADQASDGFLRMLAVFSLKYMPNPPKCVTLEEPENGVHPHLISQVVGQLRCLADLKEPNKIQVFMTSHSPYVLNEFSERPECVHIFEKGRNESVPRIVSLKDRSQVIHAAEGLNRSLGDLWYSNLLGGGAQ
jgi:predicted ATPase